MSSMARGNNCYVDTSAFIAFMDESDKHHRLFYGLFGQAPPLVTSSLTIAEGHSWFLRKYNAERAARFLAFMQELPGLTIESFGEAEISEVTALATKFRDQNLTLADSHGLAIMKQHRVTLCWSTDRHLGLTGVPLAIQILSPASTSSR
jgi:predicted nucleic acid-binding protein